MARFPVNKIKLDAIYDQYNKRKFVHPDPLEFLYSCKNTRDREIAGLIASSLAYGKVAQILKSASFVLGEMGESPYLFLQGATKKTLLKTFKNFKHRFADGADLASLLSGAKKIINRFGSLNKCFVAGMAENDKNIVPGMSFFVNQLTSEGNAPGHLLAMPEKGSACKRMNLFLRWMVRKDYVDPGGWEGIDKSKLIVPIDTHMHKIGLDFGLTSRKQANMQTALEITDGFRELSPDDPVKYDFALTRFGIRKEINAEDLQDMLKE